MEKSNGKSLNFVFVRCCLYATFSKLSFTSLCDKKRLFQKVICFFAFPHQKNWKFETNFNFGRWNLLSSIEKQKLVFLELHSLRTSNFKKSKTVKTGFEEISETSINNASTTSILLFSNAFVTLSSCRVALE